MSKPTPGPWEFHLPDGHVADSDNRPICLVRISRSNTEQSLANGHLIARSPDMEAALERIEALAEGWRVGTAPGIEAAYTDAVRVIREMRDEARKARGEQTT